MSAIFGILRLDGRAVSARDLERMGSVLAHRGPDGHKFSIDGAVGLGHGLLRVNREDLFEAQPLRDREADIVLVADLRLDNRDELASALGISPAELRDMPDSALVLCAYKRWGEGCCEHLLGDFAFAVWDGRARKLVLARDHMGQRHVYYYGGKDFVCFATEIKALWAVPDVPQILSDAQIGRMLLHYVGPRNGATYYQDIRGIAAATVMTVGTEGAVGARRYWDPHADPTHVGRDEAYYIEAYRRVLDEAVACRIRRTIRSPALMFSGGYDSAAIAGLAGPVLAAQGRKLIAAASVMPADYRGTIRHARPWVDMCARDMPCLDVHYITREGRSILTGLEQRFAETEMPSSAYHFVRHDLYSMLAAHGARLVMDGHGGDYTLNPRGQAVLSRLLATWQFGRFFVELRGHLRRSGRSLWTTLKSDILSPLLPAPALALWRRARRGSAPIWNDRPIARAFIERLVAEGAVDQSYVPGSRRAPASMRDQCAAVLREVMDNPAAGGEREAALHGLTLTRPFHDKRVVELAQAIPENLYVKDGRNRFLACAALKDIYPREFQTRWRRNDDEIPDFQRMAKSIEPQLLAEIARMEKSEILRRYIDFEKMRLLMAARRPDDHNSGWEGETQLALHGFVVARFLEWRSRSNR